MSLSPEQQLVQLKNKYEDEVKKNNNLLKMNSNLMTENELYQNCFSILKKWNRSFMNQFKTDDQTVDENSFDDSFIDIEEEGEEFVKSFTQMIERKFHQLLKYKHQNSQLKTQRDFTEQSIPAQEQQCTDCQRWKQLYMKESKQTSRLQKLIDQSSLVNTQKQINLIKLKDDVRDLLDDYLTLYKKQLGFMQEKEKTKQNSETEKTTNRQTVRMKDVKSKQKRSGSSGSKPKKVSVNPNINKEQNMFLKDKTNKNTKYTIQLNTPKQNHQKQSYIIQPTLSPQFSEKINAVLNSYSDVSNSYEQENILLKEKLRDFHQILVIYREKQRNRILFK